MRAFITTTASDPRWARLSYVEIIGVSNAVERHRIAWRERWAEFLVTEAKRAVERGEAEDRDFQLGAVALIGAVNELVHHWSLTGGARSLDDVIAEIVRVADGGGAAPWGVTESERPVHRRRGERGGAAAPAVRPGRLLR